tara:strand:+ start:2253 stop:3182 length:930 start_codon:yes stop_codon:yes gene_type:complete
MNTGYYISQKDYDKIINYAKAAYETMKCEIGGMSICYQDKDGDWIVTDPVIIQQEVTGSTCDLDKDELANYYCNAAKKHANKNFRFCWWHSHHNMGVFWSGTDIKGIDEYSDGDFSFALVVNLKRENKFRISMWNPFVMHEDTTLEILGQKRPSVPKKILDEVEELCEQKTFVYAKSDWKTRKYDTRNQANLWGDNYDDYSYGAYSYQKMNYGTTAKDLPMEQMHTYCHGKIIDWIDDLADSKLTYEEYERQVDKANDELVKLKSPYRIVKIGRSELTDELEWADPSMWIAFDASHEEKEKKTNGVSLK